jgi:hypothetical protein
LLLIFALSVMLPARKGEILEHSCNHIQPSGEKIPRKKIKKSWHALLQDLHNIIPLRKAVLPDK